MSYADQVIALYEGESYGERLFSLLAEQEHDPEVTRLWQSVAEVERLTAARVRPVAARLGADLDAQRRLGQQRALEQVEAFDGQSSREIMTYYLGRVPRSVARFRELQAQAPAGDDAVLRQFIEHSEAFGRSMQLWLEDDHTAALGALDDYLSAHR